MSTAHGYNDKYKKLKTNIKNIKIQWIIKTKYTPDYRLLIPSVFRGCGDDVLNVWSVAEVLYVVVGCFVLSSFRCFICCISACGRNKLFKNPFFLFTLLLYFKRDEQ